MNFTSDNNACGQTLLHLVARGSAIIAELLRLSSNVPSVFYLANKYDQDRWEVKVLARFHFHPPTYWWASIQNSNVSPMEEHLVIFHIILTLFWNYCDEPYLVTGMVSCWLISPTSPQLTPSTTKWTAIPNYRLNQTSLNRTQRNCI